MMTQIKQRLICVILGFCVICVAVGCFSGVPGLKLAL